MVENTSQNRRRFLKTTGIAGAAGLTGLSGCIGTLTGSNETADKIRFYNAGGLGSDPGTEENIKRFQEETGITVDVNEVPWTNLKTSLTTIWQTESSEVDVFNGPTWWLADFVSSNWLEPLGLSDDHMSRFPDNLRELVTFEDETYMAPQLGKWGSYLYDKQYLSDNGFSAPPDTWSEVVEMGSELSNDDRAGFGFTWGNKDVFTFKQLLWQAGGQMFNDNNEPVFVEEGKRAFEFVEKLRDQDALPNGISSLEEGSLGDSFIAGQFATAESWTPLGARVLNADGWDEDRLGSAKPPKGPESRATFQDSNAIGVSRFSERKEAAKKFAEFMSTTESCKTDMLVEGNPSVDPTVYDDPEIQDAYPSWLLEDMKYNLENAKSEIYISQPQVDDYLSEQITPALLGEKDPETALTEARDNIERLYQDIGLL